MIDRLFKVWALVLPISSVVLLPRVPGTTPAFLLALSALPMALLLRPRSSGPVALRLTLLLCTLIALVAASQLSVLAYPHLDIGELRLVDVTARLTPFPTTIFTQSLYLVVGLCTFVFVAAYYRPAWDRYIFAGVTLLALYGLYEWLFFLATGTSGDFLSNRTFFDGASVQGGSGVHTYSLGGLRLMRLKSLTGEPSMYAFTVLPFWIYAVHRGRRWLQWLLLLTLALSTSTTAVLGVGLYLLLRAIYLNAPLRLLKGRLDTLLAGAAVLTAVAAATAWPVLVALLEDMVVAKLTAGNLSGVQRLSYMAQSLEFFRDAPLLVQVTGIGFGTIRSTDFFSTLLVNAGVVGLILFSALFLYPVFRLGRDYRSLGLKLALIVIFTTMMVAVPEFSYLSSWLFLGMAYHQLGRARRAP